MAHRLAELVRRPFGELVPLVGWKLPSTAVWLLIGGLALVALRDERVLPSGLNLAASAGLAFGVQGLAVFKSMMSAQGMAPGLVLMLFVFAWFMLGPGAPDRAAPFIRANQAFRGTIVDDLVRGVPLSPHMIKDMIAAFADVGMDELVLKPCLAEIDQVDRLADVLR